MTVENDLLRAEAPPIRIPAVPVLVTHVRSCAWLSQEGELETLSLKEGARRLSTSEVPVLVLHALATARRLRCGPFPRLDILELFAFVRPAQFCLPTPRGLADALGLKSPKTLEDEVETLREACALLLGELAKISTKDIQTLAWAMKAGGWTWGSIVLKGLGVANPDAPHSGALLRSLQIWHKLKEWVESAAPPPPGHLPVEPVEARARLDMLLGAGAEERGEQKDYAASMCEAFQAPNAAGEPAMALVEAGTGVGKTLGYIAPASVWAKKNQGAVWISTYTRNLQRQLDGELDRLFDDPKEKKRKVVIRKGRENYFCLLNFEEAVSRLRLRSDDAPALGLMARWALASRDGDMIGGDFPSWLKELLGARLTVDMTDTRGECVYSSCSHYSKCFIEKTVRRARRAELVVANHALVMIQAALGGVEENLMPTRYIFDEGHHVFDAADKAFSAHLSGQEGADLRRWLLGAEESSRSRARGLKARIDDLVAGREMEEALDAVLHHARVLPGPSWHQRISGGEPMGPFEDFLRRMRQQVYARDNNSDSPFSLECGIEQPVEGLLESAERLKTALDKIRAPLQSLIKGMMALMDEEADELDTANRQRIEATCASLERRGVQQVLAWCSMLDSLFNETPPQFVDWYSVDRIEGRDMDVGMHRHWVDPTIPFVEEVVEKSHGVGITSATLRDGSGDVEADWKVAAARTGVSHLAKPAIMHDVKSPFDYPKQTRVYIVDDIRKDNLDQIASAYRELFIAGGGGGLGLFTAVNRLKAVYQKIAEPLDRTGIQLLAQHMDAMDIGTLIDIFKGEKSSCLLGTDAVRDGVDVPGDALHLIVFDRVPWPRPTILHKARKRSFPARSYDEMIARLRMKQAFGRLVRRKSDRGVFVMLDRQTPTRMLGAFPEGVEVIRTGLADTIKGVHEFLHEGEK
ncbi:Rad3-related DNA helicase [Candidatus Terasakiella magnetica]|uniref:Rad3-related DNA helicase n=1 Tax=Candidatus Terasakiella magnetica TaxID=1867952 RepID=A0A1C3RJI8_9PROT|nr:ATP-dependent DNA helicase [Candidatus Terasakiella magnetica]SCA57450.1 Rad3-related DNA helicase [Candidatus Terasakiella magnetica]